MNVFKKWEKVRMSRIRNWICLPVFLLWACSAFGLTESDQLIASLKPQGFVTDYAGVFSANEKKSLEKQLQQTEAETGIEIAVVAIESMKGGQIDDFTNRLFEQWKVGKKGVDNGVMLLAAINDRKMRIEVGYGLEGVLPDAAAGRIRDQYMVPYFKKGNYADGLTQGALAVAEKVGGDPSGFAPSSARTGAEKGEKRSLLGAVFKLLMFIAIITFVIRHPVLALMLLNSGSHRGYRGGSGGFGGGSSGGGGASGGW